MKTPAPLLAIIFLSILAFFLPNVTLALILDASGGDCATIGTWDTPTQTCTLTQNISGAFIVNADNITLDGAGHTITGAATSTGISASLRQNVIIKNLTFSGFSKAVSFAVTKNSRVENNTFIGNTTGISTSNGAIYGPLTGNIYRNNIFTNNRSAISLSATQGDIVEGNTISGMFSSDLGIVLLLNNSIPNIVRNNNIQGPGSAGVRGNDSDSDEFTGNTVKNFQTGLRFASCSGNHMFKENTIEGNTLGASFAGSSGTFSRNNFKNNARDIQNSFAACGNGIEVLSELLPDGGNYWSSNVTCADVNHDNICDAAYAAATTTGNPTSTVLT